jgi:hypothetical protein
LVRFAASKQSFFTLMFALFATPFAPSIALCLLQPEIRGRKFCVLPRPAPPLGYSMDGFCKKCKKSFYRVMMFNVQLALVKKKSA